MSLLPVSALWTYTPPASGVGGEYQIIVRQTADAFRHFTTPVSREKATLGQRFSALAERWQQETAPLSSITQKAMHPAYQEIIGLGRDVVPFILRELQQRPGHWFWALRAITGENPIKPEQQGRMREMAAAWIQWGRERGMIA